MFAVVRIFSTSIPQLLSFAAIGSVAFTSLAVKTFIVFPPNCLASGVGLANLADLGSNKSFDLTCGP